MNLQDFGLAYPNYGPDGRTAGGDLNGINLHFAPGKLNFKIYTDYC
jgi:hypothetical protein